MKSLFLSLLFVLTAAIILPSTVNATHSWGSYHWARTANPFTLKLGNNVSGSWNPYLTTASSDWSNSTVLKTSTVSGVTSPRRCKPTAGRVEVCNSTYGNNGWLGLAQIWVSGNHITQGVTKLNDTYFNKSQYNKPGWKNLVMCQEIGHTFGLDHQDEIFNNPNLGSCMDYTNNPTGNEHPNAHDFDQLAIIYEHLDSFTKGQSIAAIIKNRDFDNLRDWGRELRNNRHVALFERDFGAGQKLFTFVVWAED